MQKQPYSETSVAQSTSQTWFDVNKGHPTGVLVNYLVDPKNIFTSKLAKNITKLANNLVCDFEFAQKRFDEVIFQHFVLISVLS
jgi:hypothetical protein